MGIIVGEKVRGRRCFGWSFKFSLVCEFRCILVILVFLDILFFCSEERKVFKNL